MKRSLKETVTGILRVLSDRTCTYRVSNYSSLNRDSTSSTFQSSFQNFPVAVSNVNSLLRKHSNFNSSPRRCYSTNSKEIPLLTNLDQQIWPGLASPFNNLILQYLVIKPQIDSNFDFAEFVRVSKQVVEIVSRKLASNDVDGIAEMVTPETLSEIRKNLPTFSGDQRQELATSAEDIYFSAANISLTNVPETNTKQIQIYTIHHIMKGFKELIEGNQNQNQNINPFNMQQFQVNSNQFSQAAISEKSYMANYRFIREYSEDRASDWLLNGVNHYKNISNFKFSVF